jgi:hypothetical protein
VSVVAFVRYVRHHGVGPSATVQDMCVLLKAYWNVATKRSVNRPRTVIFFFMMNFMMMMMMIIMMMVVMMMMMMCVCSLVDNMCMTCEKDFIEKALKDLESECFTIGSSFDGGPTLEELFVEVSGNNDELRSSYHHSRHRHRHRHRHLLTSAVS